MNIFNFGPNTRISEVTFVVSESGAVKDITYKSNDCKDDVSFWTLAEEYLVSRPVKKPEKAKMSDKTFKYLIPSLHEVVGVIIPREADLTMEGSLPISDLVVMKTFDNKQLRDRIHEKKTAIVKCLDKSRQEIQSILNENSAPRLPRGFIRQSTVKTVKTELDKDVKYQNEIGEELDAVESLIKAISSQHYPEFKSNLPKQSLRVIGVLWTNLLFLSFYAKEHGL